MLLRNKYSKFRRFYYFSNIQTNFNYHTYMQKSTENRYRCILLPIRRYRVSVPYRFKCERYPSLVFSRVWWTSQTAVSQVKMHHKIRITIKTISLSRYRLSAHLYKCNGSLYYSCFFAAAQVEPLNKVSLTLPYIS